MTKQTFTVEGGGNFPLDMLRYDRCWPASQEDVWKISTNDLARRQVTLTRLVHNKNKLPAIDRWASYNWTYLPQSMQLSNALWR